MGRWIPGRSAAIGILLLSACLPAELRAPEPTVAPTAAGSPTATVAPAPTTSPVSTPVPTLDPTPTVAGVPQLDGLLRSLTTGWHPAGETLILEQPGDQGGRVLSALPLDGSPRVPLVAFDHGESGWDVRPNGSLALSIFSDGMRSARIAVWESATATARWASPAETGVLHVSPVWSADGASIYYSALRPPDDLGLFRVGATGQRPTRIRAPEGNGGNLERLTPDRAGLVWSRVQAGGSTDVLDLRTGRNVTFDPNAASSAVSWRVAQPRALVIKGGCCAGPPVGTLYVWDDREGVARAIFGRELASNDGVSAAAWDPTGTRIVAAVWDLAVSMEMAQSLVLLNEHGGERSTLAGTKDAIGLVWARAGILYLTPGGGRDGGHGIGTEIMLVDPQGGAPRQFFRGEYVIRWVLVSP